MKMRNTFLINMQAMITLAIWSMFLFLVACSEHTVSYEATDTPSSGEVKIAVDESFQQLFDTQIYTFQSFNKSAKINASYLPENESFNLLLKDSCVVAVTGRDLTKEERKNFEDANIYPVSTKIAEDGIAIVVNPENTDSTITIQQLKDILLGKDSLWKQFNEKSKLDKIDVVFDNAGSANARYMQDTLLKGEKFAKNVFAVKSNPEVVEYVSKNKNAIGFLSVNWISDSDDTLTQNFLQKIKVLAVSKGGTAEAFKPYQAYIKTKDYPFTRSVYMINRQTRRGLGMGFVNFVAGNKGQLMILKAGLIPSIAPVRMVEINTK